MTYINLDMYKSWLPHSLEKVVPILILQFEKTPFFCGKTLTFQLHWTPFFMVKHWTQNYPLFLQIQGGEYQNTPPFFLGKCEYWISSINTLLFANFRTRKRVVKYYEWGSWGISTTCQKVAICIAIIPDPNASYDRDMKSSKSLFLCKCGACLSSVGGRIAVVADVDASRSQLMSHLQVSHGPLLLTTKTSTCQRPTPAIRHLKAKPSQNEGENINYASFYTRYKMFLFRQNKIFFQKKCKISILGIRQFRTNSTPLMDSVFLIKLDLALFSANIFV